jgi:nicotinamide-nucleotide amidase
MTVPTAIGLAPCPALADYGPRTGEDRIMNTDFAALAPIARGIADKLVALGQTVAIADGASGGLISAGLLTIPGARSYYLGGGVIYSLAGRDLLLGLDREQLRGMKAVSEPYALLQARAIRDRFGADWGVAESGSAGPEPHPYGIEAGLCCVAVVGPKGEETAFVQTGSTDRIGNMLAFAAGALRLLDESLSRT